MMNGRISRLIRTRLYVPQTEHHYLRMIACDIVPEHRKRSWILSFSSDTDKQYRIRIQPSADHKIHHPEYRDPEIELWRSENQRSDQYSHLSGNTSMKLSGIRHLCKTRYSRISDDRIIPGGIQLVDDDNGLR